MNHPSTYIFNSTTIPPTLTHHLYLITNHPTFRQKVNEYYNLLNKNLNEDNITKIGTLFFALMLPDYPQKQLKRLAVELFGGIRTHDDCVTYANLCQYFGKMCAVAVQNVDVRSAVSFMELLTSRITTTSILNPKTNKKVVIPTQLKLDIFNPEIILTETNIPEKHHREEMKNIYFQQTLTLSEDELTNIKPEEILVKELKTKIEEVISWGYVLQDYITSLTNNNFQSKNSYRLRKCKRIAIEKQDYYVTTNEPVNNTIRDYTVNEQIFKTSGIISENHHTTDLSPSIAKVQIMSRINQTFARKNCLQKLKEDGSSQNKYYNILSQFFQRDQFKIDQLTLTRDKLIVRRKEHLLGISGKQTIKKQVKDYIEQSQNLGLQLSKNILKFDSQTITEQNITKLQSTLKQILEQDKNISTVIEQNLSQQPTIPIDNTNPFLLDVIQNAKMVPLQLVIIGRPKSGKTYFAKAVAKKYAICYISLESVVQKLFQRVKFFEENPPQQDQNGNVIGGLSLLEKYMLEELNNGKAASDEDILDLINAEFDNITTHSKGFILDLPFEYNKFWIDNLINNRIYLPKIDCRYFTHVLQLKQTQDQWKYFSSNVMIKPQNLQSYSLLDRYILNKPKPVPIEGQQQQAPPEDEQKPLPPNPLTLLAETHKDPSFSLLEHISQHIHPHRHIKIQNTYQNIQQCLSQLQNILYLIPQPKKIQGNQKQLLSVGLEEMKIFRKWSAWGVVDCVELGKGKLVGGKFQFAVQYAGRVFVFQNQVNMNIFLSNPRPHLQTPPSLPKQTNILITGPRKSGKKTLAKSLSQIYKLKVVNIQQIIQTIILSQRTQQTHIPSNFDKRSNCIHLNEAQYKDFCKGNLLNAKDVIPMVLFQLGVNLMKKPVGWGIQKNQEGEGQEEKKPLPKKPKKKDKNADQRPVTPPPEDLSLKEIIPEINHFGKLDEIRGYIIIGYPNNEEQLNTLKQFNIPIDKLLILTDNTQENPNKTLSTRLSDAELEQVPTFFTNIQPVKQALGEQICKQIFIDKKLEDIVNRVRQIIDPFYCKVDQDGLNRVCADKTQQSDPIPMGLCGEYCPVALACGWLVKGKEEFQAGVEGKRYRFSGQKEMGLFKQNPIKYLLKSPPPTPPRILLMGQRGVGLKTQLLKLNTKYRIPILSLKETLQNQLQNQKLKRKTERYYNKGFKKPQFDEQGKQIQDPQLNEQSPDFDKKAHQIDVIKEICGNLNEIFINGNFYDVEEDKVATNLVELMGQARKLPEVVLTLTCDQNRWLERVLNRKQIQNQLEQIKQKRRAQKQKQKQEARQKAQEAGEQYQQPAQQEQDPQIPKLQDMITQKQETLKAQRQADLSKIQQYTQAFKTWGIQVINIKCQRQTKHVNDRINYVLKPYIQDRINRWEKNSMMVIQRHRVPDFLGNYIVKDSRFGKLNPLSLMNNPRPYPLIYKDRIYYLKDEEQRDHVMRNPKILSKNRAIPKDIKSTPKIFILGKPKTGKTTLTTNLHQKYGFTPINLENIIAQWTPQHCDYDIKNILTDLKNGKELSDQQTIQLIEKRISMKDCQKGWILDGLPSNKRQCQLLNRKGIVPTCVLSINMTEIDIKKRVEGSGCGDYSFDREVIHQRLSCMADSLTETEIYYLLKHNNLKMLDGNLSKWGILDKSTAEIQRRIKSKRNFIRQLVTKNAVNISSVGLSFNCILNNLSDYQNFCPISYKIKRQYIKLDIRNYQNLAMYNKKIYVFKSQKELNDFIDNADSFTNRGSAFCPPQEIMLEEIAEVQKKIENKGFCMVELSKKQLAKGNSLFGVKYKNKYFLTCSAKNRKNFEKNPVLYELLKLPDKLPVEFEKKTDIKKIAKKNDCSAFLEHHLSNIMMRSLAQLGYRRPKYPTLSSKESALKFLSISLKANNPNKDDEYRQKYTEKLNRFFKECNYSQEIREEIARKQKGPWQAHDEQNLIKLSQEYNEFLKELEATDKKNYFTSFIR